MALNTRVTQLSVFAGTTSLTTRVTQLSATSGTTTFFTRVTQLSAISGTTTFFTRVTQLCATAITKLVTARRRFTRLPPKPGITNTQPGAPLRIRL